MTPATVELIAELKRALIDGAPHRATGWEWCQALDVVVAAVRAEASGPAVTGDVGTAVRSVFFAIADEYETVIPPVYVIISELTKRGVVVLGKGDYDDLRTANRRCYRALQESVERIDNCPMHMTFSRDEVVAQLNKAIVQIGKAV